MRPAMSAAFDPVSYKEELKELWSEKAELYHERFASKKVGPFKSLEQLIATADPKEGERILDVGTGTGIVALEAAKRVGSSGRVVGIDLAPGPLAIARRVAAGSNMEFLEMDAEDLKFPDGSFDAVLSEFAFMFFPDSQKALGEMKRVLRKNGRIALSVHGSADDVPYFSVIMSTIIRYVPDIIPPGRPGPHRFGEPELLRTEFERCGFSSIDVAGYTYQYDAGSFEEYWEEYMQSMVVSIRSKLNSLSPELHAKMKEECRQKAGRFMKDGKIVFPWQVLIASARA